MVMASTAIGRGSALLAWFFWINVAHSNAASFATSARISVDTRTLPSLVSFYIDASGQSLQLVKKAKGDIAEFVAILDNNSGNTGSTTVSIQWPVGLVNNIIGVFEVSDAGCTTLSASPVAQNMYSTEVTLLPNSTKRLVYRVRLASNLPPSQNIIRASVPSAGSSSISIDSHMQIVSSVGGIIVANRMGLYRLLGNTAWPGNLYGRGTEVESLLAQLYQVADGNAAGELDCVVYFADLYEPYVAEWDSTNPALLTSEATANRASGRLKEFIRDRASALSAGISPWYVLIVGSDHIIPLYRLVDPPGSKIEANNYYLSDAPFADTTGADYYQGNLEIAIGRLIGLSCDVISTLLRRGVMGPVRTQYTAVANFHYRGDWWDFSAGRFYVSPNGGYDLIDTESDPSTDTFATYDGDKWGSSDFIRACKRGVSSIVALTHSSPWWFHTSKGGYGLPQVEDDLISAEFGAIDTRPLVFLTGCHTARLNELWVVRDCLANSFVETCASALIGSTSWARYLPNESEYWSESYTFSYFGNLFRSPYSRDIYADTSIGEAWRLACGVRGIIDDDDWKVTRTEFVLYGVPWMRMPRALSSQGSSRSPAIQRLKSDFPSWGKISRHTTHSANAADALYSQELSFTASSWIMNETNGITVLSVTNADFMQVAGGPALPYYTANMFLPADSTGVVAEVVATNTTSLGNINLPGYVAFTVPSTSSLYTLAFDVSGWLPTNAVICRAMPRRDHVEVMLGICPVVHNVDSKETFLATSMIVRVSYRSSNSISIVAFSHDGENCHRGGILHSVTTLRNASDAAISDLRLIVSCIDSSGDSVLSITSSVFAVASGESATIQQVISNSLPEGAYGLQAQVYRASGTLLAVSTSKRWFSRESAFGVASLGSQTNSSRGVSFSVLYSQYNVGATNLQPYIDIVDPEGRVVTRLWGSSFEIGGATSAVSTLTWDSWPSLYGQYVARLSALRDGENLSPVDSIFYLADGWLDSDRDTLPDYWEHNLIDTSPGDTLRSLGDVSAADDSDDDGVSNAEEYYCGTDALNGGAYFGFKTAPSYEAAGGGVQIAWPSATDRVYIVESAADPFTPFATMESGVEAAPPTNVYVVFPPTNESRAVYRISVAK